MRWGFPEWILLESRVYLGQSIQGEKHWRQAILLRYIFGHVFLTLRLFCSNHKGEIGSPFVVSVYGLGYP